LALDSVIKRLVEKIREKEGQRKRFSDALREIKTKRIEKIRGKEKIIEESICSKVAFCQPSGRIVGIDGGLLQGNYHGVDLLAVRAVAVLFDYKEGKLESYDYYPSASPDPQFFPFLEALSESDFHLISGIYRATMEIETALAAAKKYRPDCLILHGSVVPYPSSKPTSGELKVIYDKMIFAYCALYEFCDKENIPLFGVVEDSRGSHFSELMAETLGSESRLRDTALLFDALDFGERTFAFKYHSHPEQHPVLMDLREWGPRLYSFYAKTATYDRPVRIDFIYNGNVTGRANLISKYLFSLSSFNRSYGLPTVIIEADSRAKLEEGELDFIYQSVSDKLGSPLALRLRREGRPF